jgi:hypothetical protein
VSDRHARFASIDWTGVAPAIGGSGANACAASDTQAAHAATPRPIHRRALLIKPLSVDCILFVRGLPTAFPDRSVG